MGVAQSNQSQWCTCEKRDSPYAYAKGHPQEPEMANERIRFRELSGNTPKGEPLGSSASGKASGQTIGKSDPSHGLRPEPDSALVCVRPIPNKPERLGSSIELLTSFGSIEAQLIGPKDGQLVLGLQGMALFNVDEWDRVGFALGSAGSKPFRVLLPNLHSNPKTSPSTMRMADIERLLLELLWSWSPGQPVILAGKSWGGGAAAMFAARYPHVIAKLVLICPAISDRAVLKLLSMPTLLAWARDDSVVPYANAQAFREVCPRLVFHAAESGGHRILNHYPYIINRFLRDAGVPSASSKASASVPHDEL